VLRGIQNSQLYKENKRFFVLKTRDPTVRAKVYSFSDMLREGWKLQSRYFEAITREIIADLRRPGAY
jgi:hypothetical protein